MTTETAIAPITTALRNTAALAEPIVITGPLRVTIRPAESRKPVSRAARLLEWRAKNPELFEQRRVEGMKNSVLVRDNLMRIHRECKAAWHASAKRNPKLNATTQHIAAKTWVLKDPTGQVHEFRNLKKWVRDNENLFEPEDVIWKLNGGQENQAWCRAFQGLSRLRPTSSKLLPEWHGWTWAA
jgi:hypothetical protein